MVGTVVGYLRHFRRWNGTPGLSFDDQRALIREVARERQYGRCGRQFLKEEADAEARDWPMLQKAIRIAEDNVDLDLLVVIPTLDGVQFNLSFLELLVGGNWPVYVRSGWRKPGIMARNTNYQFRSKSLGWLLTLQEEADAFAEIVGKIRQRNFALSTSIREGLERAASRGISLGSRRPGAYEFSKSDQSKGGQTTARRRRLAANEPYRKWLNHIVRWRADGDSLGMIVLKLADKGALAPAGRRIGPMLVCRILKRAVLNTEEMQTL